MESKGQKELYDVVELPPLFDDDNKGSIKRYKRIANTKSKWLGRMKEGQISEGEWCLRQIAKMNPTLVEFLDDILYEEYGVTFSHALRAGYANVADTFGIVEKR